MKSNKKCFDELLCTYKKEKANYEQMQEMYQKASDAWFDECEINGDMTEKAVDLGKKVDDIWADLDKASESYDCLAHLVLKYYLSCDTQ